MAKPSNTAAAFLFEKEVHMCVCDGKKLRPGAAAVDKVDYACRKHDAYHASSNLRRGMLNTQRMHFQQLKL